VSEKKKLQEAIALFEAGRKYSKSGTIKINLNEDGYDVVLSALREKLETPRWTPCAEGLPRNERKGIWEEYEVTVCESHYPTCSYDPCDAPYSKEIVTTALFDDEQKIWHICRSKEAINALLKEDDYPLNGDVIVAWRDLTAPYRADDTTGKVKEDAE